MLTRNEEGQFTTRISGCDVVLVGAAVCINRPGSGRFIGISVTALREDSPRPQEIATFEYLAKTKLKFGAEEVQMLFNWLQLCFAEEKEDLSRERTTAQNN